MSSARSQKQLPRQHASAASMRPREQGPVVTPEPPETGTAGGEAGDETPDVDMLLDAARAEDPRAKRERRQGRRARGRARPKSDPSDDASEGDDYSEPRRLTAAERRAGGAAPPQAPGCSGVTNAELSGVLGRMWKALPEAERQRYLDHAHKLRDDFDRKYPDYVPPTKQHPGRKRKRAREAAAAAGRLAAAESPPLLPVSPAPPAPRAAARAALAAVSRHRSAGPSPGAGAGRGARGHPDGGGGAEEDEEGAEESEEDAEREEAGAAPSPSPSPRAR
eukprot:tig00000448_g846.t1